MSLVHVYVNDRGEEERYEQHQVEEAGWQPSPACQCDRCGALDVIRAGWARFGNGYQAADSCRACESSFDWASPELEAQIDTEMQEQPRRDARTGGQRP